MQVHLRKNHMGKRQQQLMRRCANCLPHNTLSTRSDWLEILIALENGELSISHLHRVEHGDEPRAHLGIEERHAGPDQPSV